MRGSRYAREEQGAGGRKKNVVTVIFHCGSCGSFVRSAEQEPVICKKKTALKSSCPGTNPTKDSTLF
jgi:hypothetical protein